MGTFDVASYPGASLADVWNSFVPAAGGEVLVSAGVAEVPATVALWSGVASPRSLRVLPGGLVQPQSGVTLILHAPIQAGRWRIFDLSQGGSVMLGPAAADGVRPEWFGAAGNGSGNDLAAFQAMSRALPGGARVLLSGTYLIRYPPGTIQPVIALDILQKHHVWVEGEGGASIAMAGFGPAEARAVEDWAGVDRFTAIAFRGCTGGGVRGVHFSGEAVRGQTLDWRDRRGHIGRFYSRAKAIGITNSVDVSVRDVAGRGIVGNVVNARGDAASDATRHISVTGCYAEGCSENGFNFMGGTAECVFSDNISIGNEYSGFESGTDRITCTGNVCRANRRHGINHVGSRGTFVGNTLVENGRVGFVFQAQLAHPPLHGDRNVLAGNVMCDNGEAGISADPASRDNLISGNHLRDNGWTTPQGILLVGNPALALGPGGYAITGNLLKGGGLVAALATDLAAVGNVVRSPAGPSVRAIGGARHVYLANVEEGGDAITTVAAPTTVLANAVI